MNNEPDKRATTEESSVVQNEGGHAVRRTLRFQMTTEEYQNLRSQTVMSRVHGGMMEAEGRSDELAGQIEEEHRLNKRIMVNWKIDYEK